MVRNESDHRGKVSPGSRCGYRRLSEFLRSTWGCRVRKICIDGGFTCPNRDGTSGTGGCIFCGERGSGEHIASGIDITHQVIGALERYRDRRRGDVPEKYIAYFQNYTGTYADRATLRERYDAALVDDRIVSLAIGTRPDCVDEGVASLLKEYQPARRVWVELGLQTASDRTAQRIHRGYPSARFTEAVSWLNRYGIDVVVHLIIGLPGEGTEDLRRTVEFVNRHRLWGIKIHSLYVMAGTQLAQMYRSGDFRPISMEEYIDRTVYVLTHVSPDLIVHRLTGDCPPGLLVA
ncbi:MAG: TIGR01212 family radical SAM protein, partial [Planctomycetia bacterium]|nr:TIGR01212 family radical SAM protein [Planctomycetia bacterium]